MVVSINWADGSVRQVGNNIVSVSFESANPVVKLIASLDGAVLKETAIDGEVVKGSQTLPVQFDISLL